MLYLATRKRAYFKEIKILLPEKWSSGYQYIPAGGETYQKAEIRIEKLDNRLRDQGPYTHQNEACGVAGQYIHIQPRYFLEPNFANEYGIVGN